METSELKQVKPGSLSISRRIVGERPSIQPKFVADRLELLECIGEGGMSSVYKARHLVMNKIFAVKLLNPYLTAKQNNLKRFQQEAKAASILNHPNIITVHDCGVTHDNHAFLVMDYIDGTSLADVLEQQFKIAPERAIPIFIQTCDALAHAHVHGIIHRDLKPSNIMLLKEGDQTYVVKIVDFGIAKLLDTTDIGEGNQHLTQTGDVFGSPLYMSPEQCTGNQLDKRSDIYSLGCTMYQSLTGKPPLAGSNAFDTMRKQLHEMPAAIVGEKSENALLKRMNAIIMKCLAKEPQERYQDMSHVRHDLVLARDEPDAVWRLRSLAGNSLTLKQHVEIVPKQLLLPIICLVVTAGLTAAVWQNSVAASGSQSAFDKQSLWSGTLMPEVGQYPETRSFVQQFEQADLLRRKRQYFDAEQLYKRERQRWLTWLSDPANLKAAKVKLPVLATIDLAVALCNINLGDYETADKSMGESIEEAKEAAATGMIPLPLLKKMEDVYSTILWHTNPVKATLNALSNSDVAQEAK